MHKQVNLSFKILSETLHGNFFIFSLLNSLIKIEHLGSKTKTHENFGNKIGDLVSKGTSKYWQRKTNKIMTLVILENKNVDTHCMMKLGVDT